jgi:arsenite-transporting ATPase
MKKILENAPRFLFFTGKGGVGKTSMSCAIAAGLADKGKKVLLISTDPASNLGEVLETEVPYSPEAVPGITGLFAMNINPIQAAAQYRERMVGPYRGVLPDDAITQMEEQLSGACTVEITGFNEFSRFIGDETLINSYDHVVLDTAPTGHTLRLLNLPSAWNDFISTNQTGSSCLGPVSGLKEQRKLYEQVVAALKDPVKTLLVLVSRAETPSLTEAARASSELLNLGLSNQHLIINGLFNSSCDDKISLAFSKKSELAMAGIPEALKKLKSTQVKFRPHGVLGLDSLREVYKGEMNNDIEASVDKLKSALPDTLSEVSEWPSLYDALAAEGRGVIMTMGKGGVGKTTIAAAIATELAGRGHSVLLTTTDPAGHVTDNIGADLPNLKVDRIDPKEETRRYVDEVLNNNRDKLSADDMALLDEELRSPCIEEVAVFQAFARTVAKGTDRFIVVDTAPTGHTLLLLDSTEAYHREVERSSDSLPPEVKELLPRIRDPKFTRVLIVALPEATPTHEAEELQEELRRAGIEPFGWVINRSFALAGSKDPLLCAGGLNELSYICEISKKLSGLTVIAPWAEEERRG